MKLTGLPCTLSFVSSVGSALSVVVMRDSACCTCCACCTGVDGMACIFALYDQRLRETVRVGSGTSIDSTIFLLDADSLSVVGRIPTSASHS